MSRRGKKRRVGSGASIRDHSPVAAPERQIAQRKFTAKRRKYASFWQRLAATLVDWPIGFGLSLIFDRLLGALALEWINEPIIGSDYPSWNTLGISLSLFAVAPWMYEALFISSRWQATPGKRVVGIAVTDLNGDRISFLRATARFFAANLSWFMVYGYLIQPFTKKRQALHDLIAGTLVIQMKTDVTVRPKGPLPSRHDASALPLPQAQRKGR